MSKPNFYEILGVAKDADDGTIKKAYRSLSLKYHPDKIPINATEEDREIFKTYFLLVQLAYETLSDDERRLQYDLSFQSRFPNKSFYFTFILHYY